jgi:hypothetical protein
LDNRWIVVRLPHGHGGRWVWPWIVAFSPTADTTPHNIRRNRLAKSVLEQFDAEQLAGRAVLVFIARQKLGRKIVNDKARVESRILGASLLFFARWCGC